MTLRRRSRAELIDAIETVSADFVAKLFTDENNNSINNGQEEGMSGGRQRPRAPKTARRRRKKVQQQQLHHDDADEEEEEVMEEGQVGEEGEGSSSTFLLMDSSRGVGDGRRTARRMCAMAQVYELLVRNRKATKRDLFYEHKQLYGGMQVHFDRALSALCKWLNASRSELHVMSCSRGFAIGDLMLYNELDDDTVDFRASSTPVPIFESLTNFDSVHTRARFLLIVEKDAIFQRLIDEQFPQRHPHGILVTGRGFPDLCTRRFLHWLASHLPQLPMLALVDSDPFGLSIFLTYKFGSPRTRAESGGSLHLPRLRWLGFRPSEALRLPIPVDQFLVLTETDRRRIGRMMGRGQDAEEREMLSSEMSILSDLGWKLELEALCAISAQYLTSVYLAHKLMPFDGGDGGAAGDGIGMADGPPAAALAPGPGDQDQMEMDAVDDLRSSSSSPPILHRFCFSSDFDC